MEDDFYLGLSIVFSPSEIEQLGRAEEKILTTTLFWPYLEHPRFWAVTMDATTNMKKSTIAMSSFDNIHDVSRTNFKNGTALDSDIYIFSSLNVVL
jgi:hypothetical protein